MTSHKELISCVSAGQIKSQNYYFTQWLCFSKHVKQQLKQLKSFQFLKLTHVKMNSFFISAENTDQREVFEGHIFRKFGKRGSGPGSVRGRGSLLLPCPALWRWSLEFAPLHVRARFSRTEEVLFRLERPWGVENVRQTLVCLRGTRDKISDWRRNGQQCLLVGGRRWRDGDSPDIKGQTTEECVYICVLGRIVCVKGSICLDLLSLTTRLSFVQLFCLSNSVIVSGMS